MNCSSVRTSTIRSEGVQIFRVKADCTRASHTLNVEILSILLRVTSEIDKDGLTIISFFYVQYSRCSN